MMMELKEESNNGTKIKKLRKSSSMSSLYISSTFFVPDVTVINKAIATILFTKISNDPDLTDQLLAHEDLAYFSEEKYVRERPFFFTEEAKATLRKYPTREYIHDFLDAVFEVMECRYKFSTLILLVLAAAFCA